MSADPLLDALAGLGKDPPEPLTPAVLQRVHERRGRVLRRRALAAGASVVLGCGGAVVAAGALRARDDLPSASVLSAGPSSPQAAATPPVVGGVVLTYLPPGLVALDLPAPARASVVAIAEFGATTAPQDRTRQVTVTVTRPAPDLSILRRRPPPGGPSVTDTTVDRHPALLLSGSEAENYSIIWNPSAAAQVRVTAPTLEQATLVAAGVR